MPEVILQKSNKEDKKFDAIIDGKKTISFGAKGYSDFTRHKDEERKRNYIARHKVNQNWNDYNTAGFWAKNILWNKSSIEESIKDTDRKFKNLKIENSIQFY